MRGIQKCGSESRDAAKRDPGSIRCNRDLGSKQPLWPGSRIQAVAADRDLGSKQPQLIGGCGYDGVEHGANPIEWCSPVFSESSFLNSAISASVRMAEREKEPREVPT